jgi:hypothetical protein
MDIKIIIDNNIGLNLFLDIGIFIYILFAFTNGIV